jgi:hypothetical protein
VIPGRYLLHQKRIEKLFVSPGFEKQQKSKLPRFLGVVEELYFAL